MKTLKQLRLINWHFFANETTNIEQITFLTGANGSGKSTIIDALQIVLLGDTSGKNFNKAANERGTGRTLKGYLRGESGETEDGKIICLRKGRFTSYVVLAFYDDVAKKDFSLGIVFDYFPDETEEHRFFYLNSSFPSNNFTNIDSLDSEKARPFTSKELGQYFSNNFENSDYQFFDSNTSYQKFIKVLFGNLPDKYFSLLKKAVSFSPITNISQFITEFVCDVDHKIDIAPMQSNIEQYKLLELEATKIQKKVDSLVIIDNVYKEFVTVKDNLKLIDYISKRAQYEVSLATVKKFQEELQKTENRVEQINSLLEEKTSLITDFKNKKDLFLAQKLNDSSFSISQSLLKEKSNCEEKIEDINNKLLSVYTAVKNYCFNYDNFLNKIFTFLSNFDNSFLQEEEQLSFSHFNDVTAELKSLVAEVMTNIATQDFNIELIEELKNEMKLFVEEAHGFISSIRRKIHSFDASNLDFQNELYLMKQGKKPFDSRWVKIKNALEVELKARHSDATVEVYCDLVDINDKRWTHAIEGAIYTQKFNLFVQDKYFNEANSILKSIVKSFEYFNVSIVDAETLINKNFDLRKYSLAEEIITHSDGARAYTNYLLSSIKKCETFQEAKNSGSGILSDCSGYRHFASWYINPRLYNESFIGTKIDEASLFARNQELNARRNIQEKLLYVLNTLEPLVNIENLNSNEIATWQNNLSLLKSLPLLENSLNKIVQELEESNFTNISEIDVKLDAYEADIKETEEEKTSLLLEKGTLISRIEIIKDEKLPLANAAANSAKEEVEKFDDEFVTNVGKPFYSKASDNLAYSEISQKAGVDFAKLQNKMRALRDELNKLRSKYCSDNSLNYNAMSEETNSEFSNELNTLMTVELPLYREKILLAHQKSVKEFKDDFIYKLRTAIETVKSQIEELNEALNGIQFGRDSYKFSVTANKDFYEYYQMITDDLLLNVGDADEIFLEKYGDIMNNLFKLISDVDTDNLDQKAIILENIERFTDYRTYLLFDLFVKKDNEYSSLARTFKKQSGGETQTPFYISILASFTQLYRVSQLSKQGNSIRIVIFDEAFSKMDAARIKESVSLLRSFGLQAILSTPSEKLRDLAQHVDLVLVAIHDTKKKRSYLDKYKDVTIGS